MKRYSFLHAIILSFFSKSFYQDVGRHWRGTGFLYMFLILVVLWIPTMIKMHVGFSRFAEQEAPRFIQQIPRITITNGIVSTDVPTPYFINGDDGKPLAIIDTTGKYQSLDDTPAYILLTRNQVFARDERQTRIYDLSGVQSFELDRARAEGWLQMAKRWLVVVLFPIVLISSFVFRAIQMLIYAAVGLLFARMLNTTLSYLTLMRLSAVALTPVLILNLLLEFLPFEIPVWWLIGTLIGLGYLFFAVKSNSESSPPPFDPGLPNPPTTMPYGPQ
jgi:uncharacterized protein DUF1189